MTSVMGKSNMTWHSNHIKLFIDGAWAQRGGVQL